MATSKIISADLPPNYVSLAVLRDRWIAEERKKKRIERQEVQLIDPKSLVLTKTEKESVSFVDETDCNRDKRFAEVTNKKNQAVQKIETKSLALVKAEEESISAVTETDCNREKFSEGKKKKNWKKNKNKKNRYSEADENATHDVALNIAENKVRRSKISRKRGIVVEPGGCEKENVKKVGDVLVWQLKNIPKRGQGDGTEDLARKVGELSVSDENPRGISPVTRHFGENERETEGEAEKRAMPSEIKLKNVTGLEQGDGVAGNLGATSYNGKIGWRSNKSREHAVIRKNKYYGRFGVRKEMAQTYGVPIWVRKGEAAFGDAGAPIGSILKDSD